MERLYLGNDKYGEIDYKKIVKIIEDDVNTSVLWMNLTGKRVMGLYTRESDFDMRVVVNNPEKHNSSIIYDNIDVCIRDINTVINEYSKYSKQQLQYPTVISRENQPKNIISDYKRDDSYSVEIIETLGSDYIWDSGYLYNNADKLLRIFKNIDVIDYYFTRGWMILQKDINKSNILAIKYLMCMKNLLFAKWCLEKETIPCFDLMYLFANLDNKVVGAFFVKLINEYKLYGKTHTVDNNAEVHEYLKTSYDILLNKIYKYSRTTSLALGEDCFFSRNKDKFER